MFASHVVSCRVHYFNCVTFWQSLAAVVLVSAADSVSPVGF